MKNSILYLLALVFTLAFVQRGFTQLGTLEAVDGIKLGNTSGTDNGVIRYTGSDFEGRKNGSWFSLTNFGGTTMWNENGSKIYYTTNNVGIGTDDPLVELHVDGSNEVVRISGTSPWLGLRQTGNPEYAYSWFNSTNFSLGVTGANDMSFLTNGTTHLRIKDTGDVGIGTTIPSAKLHVKKDGEALRIDGNNPWMTFYDGANYRAFLYHDGSNFSISNQEMGKMYLKTNSLTRLVIGDTGNIGIGTFDPLAKLDVRGDAIFNEDSSDSDFRIESDDDTHAFFVDASQNRIGFGTDSPLSDVHVNGRLTLGSIESISDGGSNEIMIKASFRPELPSNYDLGSSSHKWVNVWATNGTIQTSDKRLKKDIVDIPYGLDEIMKLKPVKFKWNNLLDQDEKLGLIAQDLLPVIKEVVKTHHYERSEVEGEVPTKVKNERMGVYYSDLIPVLIKGMQEQQAQIDELKKEIKSLKKAK